jgi:phosphatidylethanolamine-binding protein (PEBP) family uncharacterized protein
MNQPTLCLFTLAALTSVASAHSWKAGEPPVFDEAMRGHIMQEWKRDHVKVASTAPTLQLAAAAVANAAEAPATAKAFLPFTKLDLRADGEFLYVGSNGMPEHNMMVGITNWQQQVPTPHDYFGDNAWRIPLHPVVSKEPASIKDRFLRGAIALAVNGIPIFNPQNNRGEVAQEIGELDQWGGHCGRGDDYHYHSAPLHLQTQAGKGMPIAYALDGYSILGLTEPDGSAVGKLDEFNGHEIAGGGYHYHASNKYPYVNGGFRGEVAEVGGQIDPQPRAGGFRGAGTPLRGAEITGFERLADGKSYVLQYKVNGAKSEIRYGMESEGEWKFQHITFDGKKTEETYRAGQGGSGGREGGAGLGEPKGKGKGKRREGNPPQTNEDRRPQRPQAAVQGILDVNGDGSVTAQEFADNAKTNATKSDVSLADAMAKAKEQFNAFDHNRDGILDTPELEELAGNAPTQGAPRQPRGDEPPAREETRQGGGGGGGRQEAFVALSDQPRSSDGKFMLNSSVVEDLKSLPVEFTGDGDGISPPLEWIGAPASTKGYALIMDHVAPGGDKKWYWTVYDIPASTSSLPNDSKKIGKIGTGFKGQVGYEPPHSKGPGAKTYVLTMYALSSPLEISGTPGREELIAAMKDKVLASSSLRVVHTSGSIVRQVGPKTAEAPPPPPPAAAKPKKGGGKGKGGPPGLIKPSIADTMKLNVYADNWFMLFVNGRLVAVDPIQFTPHNVVSVDFLPEYPMTIAVLAKDNADPKTGMEYGTNVGDGGFCLKFADGTVTNASWKAKNFFHGPVNGDTANPQVKQEPLPEKWWAIDFDDSTWKNAKEYTVEEVDPKQPYFENDFEGAKFIWSDDIALDNTLIFRTKIEKPEWKQRWNTKPDFDVTGAPNR